MTPRPMVPPSRGMRLVAEIRRGWPKLRIPAEGKPFAPTGVEVGAWVAWENGVDSFVGQVWALAPRRGCVWVVDLEARSHDVYIEHLRPAIEPGGEQLEATA